MTARNDAGAEDSLDAITDALLVHNMPQRERYGLVSTLTAFTTAGGEPPARLEIHGYLV